EPKHVGLVDADLANAIGRLLAAVQAERVELPLRSGGGLDGVIHAVEDAPDIGSGTRQSSAVRRGSCGSLATSATHTRIALYVGEDILDNAADQIVGDLQHDDYPMA